MGVGLMGFDGVEDGFLHADRRRADGGEEGRDSGFVGSPQEGRGGAALLDGAVAELEEREAVVIDGGELELGEGFEVQALGQAGGAVGPGEGVLDRGAHVGGGELGDERAIVELGEGVDEGLGMDEGVDLFGGEAEEPVGLDDFEGLVDEGGGVDGDLAQPRAGPGWVPRGQVWGCGFDLLLGPGAEGAAAGGENGAAEARDFEPGWAPFARERIVFPVFGSHSAQEALPECGVLAVDGEERES